MHRMARGELNNYKLGRKWAHEKIQHIIHKKCKSTLLQNYNPADFVFF